MKKLDYKISIIVPVYKVEKYLDKCVESIVNQTYKNLEIILVDDGSPDTCPQLCDKWKEKDERIKVIHKQNGGLSDARNFGIEASTGELIMFVDSDDYLDVTICEKLLSLLEQNNADFSMCACKKVFENKEVVLETFEPLVRVYDKEMVIDQMYNMQIPFLMTAWAKLYKKEIFEKIRYPKGKLHEDEFIIHEILHKTNCFVVTNEQLYYYLQRGSSIMGSRGEQSIKHSHEAFKNRFEFLKTHYPQNTDKNIASYLRLLRALICLCSKKFKQIEQVLWNEYKEIYKMTSSHSKNDILFRRLKGLYKILYRIRVK